MNKFDYKQSTQMNIKCNAREKYLFDMRCEWEPSFLGLMFTTHTILKQRNT